MGPIKEVLVEVYFHDPGAEEGFVRELQIIV